MLSSDGEAKSWARWNPNVKSLVEIWFVSFFHLQEKRLFSFDLLTQVPIEIICAKPRHQNHRFLLWCLPLPAPQRQRRRYRTSQCCFSATVWLFSKDYPQKVITTSLLCCPKYFGSSVKNLTYCAVCISGGVELSTRRGWPAPGTRTGRPDSFPRVHLKE